MPNEWKDPLNQAYKSAEDKLQREANRLRAGARFSNWSTGMQDSSLADIGYGQINTGYLDALQSMESSKAGEALNWMKYDQAVKRAQDEQARRERMAKEAGWWDLGGKVLGAGLSVIPGGNIFGKFANALGRGLTGMPMSGGGGQVVDPNLQEPDAIGANIPKITADFGQFSNDPNAQWNRQRGVSYTNPWQPTTNFDNIYQTTRPLWMRGW